MFVDRVAKTAGDLIDRALEALVAERLNLAAVAADQMVMMVAVRARGLEARHTVARIDPLHEP